MNRYRVYRGNTSDETYITISALSPEHAYYLFCEFMTHAIMGESLRRMKALHGLDVIEAGQSSRLFDKIMNQELSYGAFIKDLESRCTLEAEYDKERASDEWLSDIIIKAAQ